MVLSIANLMLLLIFDIFPFFFFFFLLEKGKVVGVDFRYSYMSLSHTRSKHTVTFKLQISIFNPMQNQSK